MKSRFYEFQNGIYLKWILDEIEPLTCFLRMSDYHDQGTLTIHGLSALYRQIVKMGTL